MLKKLKQLDKSPVIKAEVITNLFVSVILYWSVMQYVPWHDYFAKEGYDQPYMVIPVEGASEGIFIPISGLLSFILFVAIFFITANIRRFIINVVSLVNKVAIKQTA